LKLPTTPRAVRALSAAAVAALTLAGTLAVAAPAMAAFHSPSDFNRAQVIMRARQWVKDSPYYDQTSSYHGYRRDCSGFVSMAWGLGTSYVTWTLPEVAWPIHKSDLTMGDIMLNQGDADQHVVIFDKWANGSQTAYWEYELAGSTNRPVHRVVPYPFWTSDRGYYKPYRFARAKQYTGKQPPPPQTVKALLAKLSGESAKPATSRPAKKAALRPHRLTKVVPRKAPAKPPARAHAGPRVTVETPRPAPAARRAPVKAPRPRIAERRSDMDKTLKDPVFLVLLRSLVAWIAS
jgi:hypothetical protein